MGWERTFEVSVEINAPVETVWRRISDHEGTPGWVKRGLRSVRVIEPGNEVRGGTGALRAVKFAGWPTVTERIVRYDEGVTFEYKVIAGMPQLEDHLGRLSVESLGAGTKFSWFVWFHFRPAHPLSWFAPLFLRSFRGVLHDGLLELKRQCEGPPR